MNEISFVRAYKSKRKIRIAKNYVTFIYIHGQFSSISVMLKKRDTVFADKLYFWFRKLFNKWP